MKIHAILDERKIPIYFPASINEVFSSMWVATLLRFYPYKHGSIPLRDFPPSDSHCVVSFSTSLMSIKSASAKLNNHK